MGIFQSEVGRPVFFVSIFKSRLCQLPYCMHALKTSGRWGQVGEQHGVIYDKKSRVVSLDNHYPIVFFFLLLLFLKTIFVNGKGSDFYSHSENVCFSCLKTSYCI